MSWPTRSRLVAGAVISLVVLVAGLLTLEWTHAFVLAALPLALVLLVRSLEMRDEPIIAADRLTQGAGRRDEMTALVWAMRSRSGRVPPRTMRRVGDLAARLLAHHGIVSEGGFPLMVHPGDEQRARALLGAGAHVLLDADPRTETHPRDLDRCLGALEALDPTDRPTAPRTGGSR